MSGETEPEARLRFSTDGAVAVVRLHRPEVRNAIDDALQGELIATFERVATAPELRALVLTGEGSAFCAGGDVSGMRTRLELPPGRLAETGLRRLRLTQRMVSALDDLDVVTVAAVNGPAFGVGMDLALCCDVVVASEAAAFSMGYVLRGLVPDGGGLYYLPRRVGLARAKELIYTGRRVEAQEALALGIADRVVPADELEAAALECARDWSGGAGPAIGLAKAVLNRTFELTREEVFARSAAAQAICYTTDEHRSSVAAFLDRPSERAHAGESRPPGAEHV